jgi:hypothetical protein
LSLRQNWIKCGLAVLALAAPAFGQIVVYHTVTTVEIGASRQFTAYVPLSPNTVVWSANGVNGGNAAFGTVTNTGMFQAPVIAPTPSVVKIRATSTAYPDKFGEATVTLTRPAPWIWSITPKTIAPGSFEIRLNGANYRSDAQVRMNGAPLTTTYFSTTGLRATGTAEPRCLDPDHIDGSVRRDVGDLVRLDSGTTTGRVPESRELHPNEPWFCLMPVLVEVPLGEFRLHVNCLTPVGLGFFIAALRL